MLVEEVWGGEGREVVAGCFEGGLGFLEDVVGCGEGEVDWGWGWGWGWEGGGGGGWCLGDFDRGGLGCCG